MHSIIIKTYPSDSAKNDVVRLSPEAAEIIREYQRETGLTARYIVSEIIRQSQDITSFEKVGEQREK